MIIDHLTARGVMPPVALPSAVHGLRQQGRRGCVRSRRCNTLGEHPEGNRTAERSLTLAIRGIVKSPATIHEFQHATKGNPPLWGPMTANVGANPVDFGGSLAPGTFRPLKSRREIDHRGGRLLRSLTDFRRQRKLGTTELRSGTSASLRTGFSRVRCRAQCRGSQRTIELQTRLR